ncbi:MAG: hypothetical protein WCG49_06450 [Actinomycetes bacterium]
MAKAPGLRKFRKIVGDDIETLRTEMLAMRTALENAQQQIQEVTLAQNAAANSLAAIDGRVVQLGRELTNQLHELSNDLEKLEQQSDGASVETIAQLQATQIRLATEQARYEITFRQDLAEIADQLRRPR